MNKKQRALLIRLVLVITVTAVLIMAVGNVKDIVNRQESARAYYHLAQKVTEYRKEHGTLPTQYFIDQIRDEITGKERVGKLNYRLKYINYASAPDTILFYTKKDYAGFLVPDGYFVMRLNGSVQWLTSEEFQNQMTFQWGIGEEEQD